MLRSGLQGLSGIALETCNSGMGKKCKLCEQWAEEEEFDFGNILLRALSW